MTTDDEDSINPTYQEPLSSTEDASHSYEPIDDVLSRWGNPDLVGNREVAEEALFKGELPYEPAPEEDEIGISGLWRAYTRKKGRNGDELQPHLDQLPKKIEQILTDHQRVSRYPDMSPEVAIFSFLNPETQRLVTDITADVFKYWEKAVYRNKYPFLLSETAERDNLTPERLAHLLGEQSLVVESAAAIMTALPAFTDNPNNPSKDTRESLAKVLANWGPKFLTEWMSGSIIQRWCLEQGYSEQETQSWMEIFTPSVRKRFAVHNISNPMEAISRVKHNLETVLTTENISGALGWSSNEVEEVFTPGLRKRFAVRNISDPMEAISRVKHNLETVLTTENISGALGWSSNEVEEVFTPGLRKRFAVHNISNPMEGVIEYSRGNITYGGRFYNGAAAN